MTRQIEFHPATQEEKSDSDNEETTGLRSAFSMAEREDIRPRSVPRAPSSETPTSRLNAADVVRIRL